MADTRHPMPGAETGGLVLVALGSNLGDPIATVQAAMERLESLSASSLRRSSLWRSAPVDCPAGSSDFVNAVVALEPLAGETPESLLEKLQAVETAFGRRPKQVHNEPRPLDLDLVAFGAERRSSARLTLPHPRAHLRGFVLAPLAELVPDWVLPGQHRTVRDLLAGLEPDAPVRRLSA